MATDHAPAAPESAPEPIWTVPNLLTVARLGLTVGVFALIGSGRFGAALIVFGLAAITDALDGYAARKLNQATALGRQLDTLADKIAVCGTLVYLVVEPGSGVQPWMVVVILAREFLVQTLRSHVEGRGIAFKVSLAGKCKATVQFLAIVGSLGVLTLTQPSPALLLVRDGLLLFAVALTVYSGADYVWAAVKGGGPSRR